MKEKSCERNINTICVERIMKDGLEYIRSGDYFIPNLTLPEETRPIGKWGRMHREYLKEHKPIQYNCLLLSGKLWTYLADLNEQAQDRLERIIDQKKTAEGVTEELKAAEEEYTAALTPGEDMVGIGEAFEGLDIQ